MGGADLAGDGQHGLADVVAADLLEGGRVDQDQVVHVQRGVGPGRLVQHGPRGLQHGRRAVGVRTAAGELRADAVVVNADFADAMTKLVPDRLRRRWTDAKLEKKTFSCSLVLTGSPFFGATTERMRDPCIESASVVVKNNVTAIMCSGL